MQVPRLPYDPVNRASAPVVQNGTRYNPDDFGAGVGRAIEQSADDWRQVAMRARAEADQIAVDDRLNQFDTLNNKRLTDAQQRRGEAAFDLPKTVNEDFDASASEIGNSLSNDRQKTAYNRAIAGRKVATNRFIDGHVATQAAEYREEVYANGKAKTMDTIGLNFADEGVVNASINAQVSRTERYADETGRSPEWRAQEHSNIVSTAHATVISQFLNNDATKLAQQHFNRYGDEMTAKDRAAVKDGLEKASNLRDAQATVDELLSEKGEINDGLSLSQGLDKIKEKYKDEPEIRAQAEQRWTTSFRQREQNRVDENNAVFNRVYATMLDPQNSRGLDAAQTTDLVALRTRDPKLYAALEADNARRLRREEPVQDWAVWTQFQTDLAREPDAVKKLNLSDFMVRYRGSMDNEHFDRAVQSYAQLQGNADSGAALEIAAGARSEQQIISGVLEARGLTMSGKDAPKPGTQGAKDQEVLLSAIDKAISAKKATIQRDTGKKVNELPPTELNKVISDVLKDNAKTYPGGWFSAASDKIVGAKTAKDRLQDIPDQDLQQILDAYRAAGRTEPPSAQEVIDLYDRRRGR